MSDDLKNKLDQAPLEFDTALAWEQLSPKLESAKRRRRGFIWWWMGGAAGLALMLLATLYFYQTTTGEVEHPAQPIVRQKPLSPAATRSAEDRELDGLSDAETLAQASKTAEKTGISLADAGISDERTDSRNASRLNAPARRKASQTVGLKNANAVANDQPLLNESETLNSQARSVSPVNTVREVPISDVLVPESSTISEADTALGDVIDANTDAATLLLSDLLVSPHFDGLTALDVLEITRLPLSEGELKALPALVKSDIQSSGPQKKPYWQIGVLAGAGYEFLRTIEASDSIKGRKLLELRSLRASVTRSFNDRVAITINGQFLQRHELYRTDFTNQYPEVVYNPASLVAGNTAFGDSVTVLSERRLMSDRYARFTRLNVGAMLEYLVPTQVFDFAVYGGVNYTLQQQWKGSRMVQVEAFSPIVEDTRGPYFIEGGLRNRLSYTLGTRVSKPLGTNVRLLFDARAVLLARYNIESAFRELHTESGSSLLFNLGLAWRID